MRSFSEIEEICKNLPKLLLTGKVQKTINNLSNFSKSNNINYKVLKMFNPWLRTNRLPNSSRRTYEITLPKKEFLPLFITQE